MEPDFWHRRWHNNEIGFHQEQINLHLQSFWSSLQLQPPTTVFVPLCGKSKDMVWLADQGYEVVGVELSAVAVENFFRENRIATQIDRHRNFTRYRSEHITLLVGDFFDLQDADLGPITAVYDRASLIAFPPDMRTRYASHLCSLLPPAARMLLISLTYPEDAMKGPPFSVQEYEVRQLFEEEMQVEKVQELDVLHENPRFLQRGISALQETVFRLIKKSR